MAISGEQVFINLTSDTKIEVTTDMPEGMVEPITQFVLDTLKSEGISDLGTVSQHIGQEMCRALGPSFQCVIGTDFHMVFTTKGNTYFQIRIDDAILICIWQT